MNIKCNLKELINGLNIVSKASNKTTMPILPIYLSLTFLLVNTNLYLKTNLYLSNNILPLFFISSCPLIKVQ